VSLQARVAVRSVLLRAVSAIVACGAMLRTAGAADVRRG